MQPYPFNRYCSMCGKEHHDEGVLLEAHLVCRECFAAYMEDENPECPVCWMRDCSCDPGDAREVFGR